MIGDNGEAISNLLAKTPLSRLASWRRTNAAAIPENHGRDGKGPERPINSVFKPTLFGPPKAVRCKPVAGIPLLGGMKERPDLPACVAGISAPVRLRRMKKRTPKRRSNRGPRHDRWIDVVRVFQPTIGAIIAAAASIVVALLMRGS